MRPTLFPIPDQIAGLPVFGIGVLLAVWALFSVGLIVWLVRRQGFSADTRSYLPVLILVAAAIVFLLPGLVQPGVGLPIRGYGVLMLVGVVAGVALGVWRAERAGIDADFIFSLAFWMFVAGILGARLFHIIEYWEESYRQPPGAAAIDWATTFKRMLNVPEGGLVVYGGFLAGGIAAVWYVRRHKFPALVIADLVAPCLVLGLAFGRLGCLMNGCCFGGPCDHWWAISFPYDSLPYHRQVERGLLYGIQIGSRPASTAEAGPTGPREVAVVHWVRSDVAASGLKPGDRIVRFQGLDNPTARQIWEQFAETDGAGAIEIVTDSEAAPKLLHGSRPPPRTLRVHPTQIYSSINALLLCLLLLAFHPFRRRDGEVFALLLTLYPVTRFILEIIRTDEMGMFGTVLSISQIVSILVLIGVLVLWAYIWRQPKGQLWTAASAVRR